MITVQVSADKKTRTITVTSNGAVYTAVACSGKWDVYFNRRFLSRTGVKGIEAAVMDYETARARAHALPQRRFAYATCAPWSDARGGKLVKGEHVFRLEGEIVAVKEHMLDYDVMRVVSETGRPDASIAHNVVVGTGGSAALFMPLPKIMGNRDFRWLD